MGAITSKDTRRISFVNTFALSPPLDIQNYIEDDNNILAIDTLSADKDNELIFPDNHKCTIEGQQGGEIDYWSRRIDCLKNEHRLINKILEDEYDKTIEYTNKLLDIPQVTAQSTESLKPCCELRSKIIKCYEDNPLQPLVCSAIVQNFSNCVESCRVQE